MKRPPPSWTPAAIVALIAWIMFTALFLGVGAPWWLSSALVSGGLLLWTPIQLLLSAHDNSRSAAEKQFQEYRDAGFEVDYALLSRKVVITGRQAGVEFTHYNVPRGRGTPARIVLWIGTHAPGEFEVSPETPMTELAKTFRMVDEFQTGDAVFDKNYYFSGSTDEYVRTVFADRRNFDLLRSIFAGSPTAVEKGRRRITASASGSTHWPVEEVKSLVEQLSQFHLPNEVPGARDEVLTGRVAMFIVGVPISTFLIAGFCGFLWSNPLLDGGWAFAAHEAPLSALFVAAAAGFAYLVLRGHSMAAPAFALLLFLSPLLGAAVVGILMLANQGLDESKASTLEAQLLRTSYQPGGSKSGTHYYLVFSWREHGSQEFEVDRDTYVQGLKALKAKQLLWQLRTREGWLGEAWVQSMQPANMRKAQ